MTNLIKSLPIVLAISVSSVSANTVEQVVDEGQRRVNSNAASQQQIDQLADITDKRRSEYRHTLQTVDNLKTYNQLLKKQVNNQNERINNIHLALENTAKMQRDILPLMEEMINNLDQFVQLDAPFLSEERKTRVQHLKKLIHLSNIDIAEKFRQVTEAYQTEMDYGRTIETYRDTLTVNESELELTLLRIGRVALLYRSDDGQHIGRWNNQTQTWEPLEISQYERAVKNGVAIAAKQKAPSLITVPIMLVKNSSGGK